MPGLTLNAGLTLEHRRGNWTSAIEFRAVDAKSRVQAARNEVPAAGYALINLRTGYEWRPTDATTMRLDAGADNLANRSFILPLGLRDAMHTLSGPMAGPIFETAVLTEILKTFHSRGEDPQVSFFRTSTGMEVDFVIEINRSLIPIEVKSAATPRPEMASGLITFKKDFGRRVQTGYVINTGDVLLPLAPGITAIPFNAL